MAGAKGLHRGQAGGRKGLGFRVFGVLGLGFRVFGVLGLGSRVLGLGFRVLDVYKGFCRVYAGCIVGVFGRSCSCGMLCLTPTASYFCSFQCFFS